MYGQIPQNASAIPSQLLYSNQQQFYIPPPPPYRPRPVPTEQQDQVSEGLDILALACSSISPTASTHDETTDTPQPALQLPEKLLNDACSILQAAIQDQDASYDDILDIINKNEQTPNPENRRLSTPSPPPKQPAPTESHHAKKTPPTKAPTEPQHTKSIPPPRAPTEPQHTKTTPSTIEEIEKLKGKNKVNNTPPTTTTSIGKQLSKLSKQSPQETDAPSTVALSGKWNVERVIRHATIQQLRREGLNWARHPELDPTEVRYLLEWENYPGEDTYEPYVHLGANLTPLVIYCKQHGIDPATGAKIGKSMTVEKAEGGICDKEASDETPRISRKRPNPSTENPLPPKKWCSPSKFDQMLGMAGTELAENIDEKFYKDFSVHIKDLLPSFPLPLLEWIKHQPDSAKLLDIFGSGKWAEKQNTAYFNKVMKQAYQWLMLQISFDTWRRPLFGNQSKPELEISTEYRYSGYPPANEYNRMAELKNEGASIKFTKNILVQLLEINCGLDVPFKSAWENNAIEIWAFVSEEDKDWIRHLVFNAKRESPNFKPKTNVYDRFTNPKFMARHFPSLMLLNHCIHILKHAYSEMLSQLDLSPEKVKHFNIEEDTYFVDNHGNQIKN